MQPVYDALEARPDHERAAQKIHELDSGGRRSETLRCATPPSAPSVLEGVWGSTVSPAEMRASGATAAEAATFGGRGTLELHGGRWTFRNDRATVKGTYRVRGVVLRLTMRTCTANPCSPGMVTEYGWSVYRDRLSLARRPGRLFWPTLVAAPSRRVG